MPNPWVQTYLNQAPDWALFARDPAAYQAWMDNQSNYVNQLARDPAEQARNDQIMRLQDMNPGGVFTNDANGQAAFKAGGSGAVPMSLASLGVNPTVGGGPAAAPAKPPGKTVFPGSNTLPPASWFGASAATQAAPASAKSLRLEDLFSSPGAGAENQMAGSAPPETGKNPFADLMSAPSEEDGTDPSGLGLQDLLKMLAPYFKGR